MPKIEMESLISLMHQKERIRNVGIIAHIDHGKTTMSDSLLAAAGILSPKTAGQARKLDYLEVEQKRGITIKSANISLLHRFGGDRYVINLVDTPGHVDFTGHVTRALRVIDGAICVVDAVEEVMVQTETVTRQALEMRVKPVLFINKVDRLITELRLKPPGIQKKLERIIRDYNRLINIYAEPEYRDKWQVSFAKGNVAFGSAIDKWGLTFEMAKKRGFMFSDVIDAYLENRVEELQREIPLHEAILGMVIKNTPSPLEAQKYRIPALWKGDLNSEIGKSMVKCDENGPLVISVNKINIDPHAGAVTTGRILSGTIHEGDEVFLLMARSMHRIQQVSLYMGADREIIKELPAGNIVALLGLPSARAGETIVTPEYINFPPFEKIKYVTEPVVTMAIEPKRPQDLPKLIEYIRKTSIEDPNLVYTINEETGETLISGMGELHIEIVINNIRETGIEIVTSPPVVVYRETVRGSSSQPVLAKSPNKHNRFWLVAEPLNDETMKLLEDGKVTSDMPWRERARILREEARWNASDARNIWVIDDYMNIFVNRTSGVQYLDEVREMIISAFRWSTKEGPLCGEPLRGVKIALTDVQIHEDPVHRGPAQVMPAIRRAVYGSVLSAEPILMEPIYKIQVTVPTDTLGKVIGVITSKRGRIERMEERQHLSIVYGYIPVAETIGFASIMRKASSGKAFWQNTFSHWEIVPEKLSNEIAINIRKRKGKKPEIPRAEEYMDTL